MQHTLPPKQPHILDSRHSFFRHLFFYFILGLKVVSYASAADYEKIIFDDKDSPIIIKKLAEHEHTQQILNIFEETERVESHQKNLGYRLESPFGVYVAYERENERPVAIQSFSSFVNHGHLVAEGMTDVLKAFQGKGYGSKLRIETAKWLSQFLDNNVECGRGEESSISELPLTFLQSDNEWEWGRNYPSLKSSITAGYGIACISNYSTIQMLYTKNESIKKNLWSEDRVSRILKISKFMMDPSAVRSETAAESIDDDFTYILNDLDLTQETDIVTFLTSYQKMIWILKGNPSSYSDVELFVYRAVDKALSRFLSSLDKATIARIKLFAEGHRFEEEQRIPIDLLYHCLGQYTNWEIYHLLAE
ncbi:MAG: hypothetical protein K0M45_11255 [Candidatus Paracaedibacteraceae bacterium]|nr:hypothetical protein [Candidatus Paracaedibacteraceae bacterium]